MRSFKFQKTESNKKTLKIPSLKKSKTDFDKINELKNKSKVKDLRKIYNSSKKREVHLEIVNALVEIGSMDSLLTLHGISQMPTEPTLHDEITNQFSRAMDSYILSNKAGSPFDSKGIKQADGKSRMKSLAFWKSFHIKIPKRH